MKFKQSEVNCMIYHLKAAEKKMTSRSRAVEGEDVEVTRRCLAKLQKLQKRRRPA